jgi:cupin fold WbuC family metalloprotein
LCDFIIKLIEVDCLNKVLHLGQPDNVTLREILCYLKKEFNSESEIKEGNSFNKRYFTLPIHDAEQEGYTGRGIFVILDELINCQKQREPQKKVLFNHSTICKIGDHEIEHLKSEARCLKAGDIKYCLHENITDKVHEMINIYTQYSWIRPHYHPEKIETKIILEGKLLVLIFDEDGNIIEHFIMSNEGDGSKIVHLQPKVIHTNIPLTDVVFLEVTSGPFVAEKDNIYIESLPQKVCKEEVEKYVNNLYG